MIVFSIFVLPFIQFGLGWWVSVSSFGCLALLVQKLRTRDKKSLEIDPVTVVIISLIAVTYLWQDFGNLHTFLRTSRETLILILLVSFTKKSLYKHSTEINLKIDWALFSVIIFEFLLVLIQFVFLRRGVWIGPSASWLAGRGNLIPTLLDLQYSKLRPSGTFSEPSYLGIICLSIQILISRKPLDSKKNQATYFLSLLTIVLCQSKSALFFALAIFLVQERRKRLIEDRKVNTFLLPLAMFVSLPFFGLLSGTLRSSRGSISIQSRIFEPLSYSLDFVLAHPLGIPFYERILEYIDPNKGLSWETISHNSIFNFIFSYGLVGLIIVLRVTLIAKRSLVLLLYLLALLLQNGSFLDFDKLFLVSIVFAIYRTENDQSNV